MEWGTKADPGKDVHWLILWHRLLRLVQTFVNLTTSPKPLPLLETAKIFTTQVLDSFKALFFVIAFALFWFFLWIFLYFLKDWSIKCFWVFFWEWFFGAMFDCLVSSASGDPLSWFWKNCENQKSWNSIWLLS